MNGQRLDKILANFGYGTRSEIKKIIKSGIVKVDGIVEKDSSKHIEPDKSTIEIGDQILNYRKYIYLMMNKPQDVITATFDKKHTTVADIIPDEYKCFDLFPVGRLDIDTEGLLILTNNGDLSHELLSPRKHVSKIYYTVLDGLIAEDAIEEFKKGVVIDGGYKTLPSDLKIIKQGLRSECEITIYEGKFHQVKRMFEAIGLKVIYLKRIQMAALKLDENLKPGECKELNKEDIRLLGAEE